MAEINAPVLTWEKEVEHRTTKWRSELITLADKRDLQSLQVLKTAVDAQLAIAELMIKSRQADWAKVMVWGQLWLPLCGVIIGAIIAARLK
jgi:hypothetical protein